MSVTAWPVDVDEVLAGDLTAALSYTTPAGGTVVTAVAPLGLRDRAQGTLTFTTSLGFGRKLERMQRDPRVALAYHAREHGFARSGHYILAQGDATVSLEPDPRFLEEILRPQVVRHMGPPRSGPLWDRILREYYRDRVPVTVRLRRIVTWPDLLCSSTPEVHGEPLPGSPPPQPPPGRGTAPRVRPPRAARRCRRRAHRLIAWRQSDGYPIVLPVELGEAGAAGLALRLPAGLLPSGGRRAGLLAHDYGPQLIGLAAHQHTGWLVAEDWERGRYAPHTEQGFRAPAQKTLLLLANGLVAKRGLREARAAGRLERLRAGGPGAAAPGA